MNVGNKSNMTKLKTLVNDPGTLTSRGARGNEGERKSGPNLNQEYFFLFFTVAEVFIFITPRKFSPKTAQN